VAPLGSLAGRYRVLATTGTAYLLFARTIGCPLRGSPEPACALAAMRAVARDTQPLRASTRSEMRATRAFLLHPLPPRVWLRLTGSLGFSLVRQQVATQGSRRAAHGDTGAQAAGVKERQHRRRARATWGARPISCWRQRSPPRRRSPSPLGRSALPRGALRREQRRCRRTSSGRVCHLLVIQRLAVPVQTVGHAQGVSVTSAD
jgi:hypothetical protein